ncbi:MAG: hypothetical protein PVG78_08935 [Desulfobacterales bacterium]|jgi:hypothetical protein
MDKKELLEMAADPNFIPGIYNYCDRWCGRCPFTSRCLNYAMEEDEKQKAEGADEDNRQFWDHIGDSFDIALSLLEDLADEFGIDLETVEIETEAGPDNKEHIVSRMADHYIKMVGDWFDRCQGPLAEAVEKEASPLKVVRSDAEKGSIPLSEALEVIGYYQFFIGVKLDRALRGKDEEAGSDFDDIPKDSDGSAKIALIAMDRSISAWGVAASYLPDHKGRAAEIIARLRLIRDITEKEFPEARAFVRPGFDE